MIAAGSRLGPYEILAPLGAGGMGEVYRARDTRLGRDVAVKVLPESVARDADAVARFEREARAVAALSHVNILSIHDFGREGGTVYAVTELLEGQTLGELLGRGPLAPRKAAGLAREIAEGLAAAHARGIVHRDLKPENVFVTKDGHVKILDFGLARDLGVRRENETSAPTERPLTEPGTVMGTVGFMSPEQVRGIAVDHRSDVFSFGAILYEMLSGRRAFQKPTAAETMTAILNEEPPELPTASSLALSLERVARRCLEKSPDTRFQDTRDLVFALEMASEGTGSSAAQPAAVAKSRALPRALAAALGIAVVAAVATGGWLLVGRARTAEPPQFEPVTFRRGYVRGARFTPDGRSIVYAASWEGGPLRIYLKTPESPDALPLDLPSANLLAISPQGELAIATDCRRSHAGVCRGTLARVALAGGSPRETTESVEHADFAGGGLAIVREPPSGKPRLEFPEGKVLYESQQGHISFPRVSPDGRRIAFFDHPFPGDDMGSVAVVDLTGKKSVLTKRFPSLRGLAWSPSGDEIWFAGFDGGARALFGVRLSGALRVLYRAPAPLTLCDVSRDGRVLLSREEERNGVLGVGPGETTERELSWLEMSNIADMSRDGKLLLLVEQGAAAKPEGVLVLRRMDGSPPMRLGDGFGQLSPDGKRVFNLVLGPGAPIKILPVGPGETTTLKLDGLDLLGMSWFPDSRRLLLYGRLPGQPPQAFIIDPDSGARRSIVFEGPPPAGMEVTPDSRRIVTHRADGILALYPIDGGTPVSEVKALQPGDTPVHLSADGRTLFVAQARDVPLQVFRIDVQSGARTHWKDFEPADKAGLAYVRQVVISADGSAYAYQFRRWLSDLYIVQGLR